MNISTTTILNAINQSRVSQNLLPLKFNAILSTFAQNKANDMEQKQYFSHISPEGKIYKDFVDTNKYNWSNLGENLAIKFTDPTSLENAWMNSPLHKANILNGSYKDIGIATQGPFIVTFFGRATPTESPAPVVQKPVQRPAPPPAQSFTMPHFGMNNANSTIPIALQITQKVNNMVKLR